MTQSDAYKLSPVAKTRLIWTFAVLLGGSSVISMLAVLKQKPEPKTPDEPPPARVEVVAVQPQTHRVSIYSQGSVTPVLRINLVSEVAGRVVAVAEDYADGGFFAKDQTIAKIDDRDYQFALRQAESDVLKARELYAIEKGRGRKARREWRDLGDLEANELFLRKPQLASAQAAVDAALAMRDAAKLDLTRTEISAPFDGRIITKNVDVGQYVSPGAVIAEVYSTESVLVRLPLTDRQVAQVDLPLTASAGEQQDFPEVVVSTVYGGKTYSWQGQIKRTEGSFDMRSRVVYAVAEIDQPFAVAPNSNRPPLAVGMYVSAEIIGRELENTVRLPRKVLHKTDEIIIVDEQDKLAFRQVEVLQNDGEEMLVRGLQAGDRVMTTRLPYVVTGLQVNTGDEDAAIADLPSEATAGPQPVREGES